MALSAAVISARRAALSAARVAEKARRARELAGARAKVREKRRTTGRPEARDSRPSVLSAEGIAMLSAALILDIVLGVAVIFTDFFGGIGEVVFAPVKFFGTMILGFWMYARQENPPAGNKLLHFIKKRGIYLGAENVPIISAGPWHTINVFMFLRK